MLYISNHQGNANQNHSEVTPHICQIVFFFFFYQKRQQITIVGEEVEKRRHSCTVGGRVHCAVTMEDIMPIPPVLLQMKTVIRKDTCTPMFIGTLFTIAKVW